MGNIHVKLYDIWISGSGDVIQGTETICEILVEGIMRNNPVKLF